MPELPEVEVTRRTLQPGLVGARILGVFVGKPLRWPLGVAPSVLVGRVVLAVERRGKYLLLVLDSGVLLVHLGMSGSLRWQAAQANAHGASELANPKALPLPPQQPLPSTHDHFIWQTTQGVLTLNDPRRFGAVVYSAAPNVLPASKLLHGLGLEPLSPAFTPASLAQGLAKHKSAIKCVLLAGKVVVGVGNIYASEALFRARIHPATSALAVQGQAVVKLHTAIVDVLHTAVEMGGTTLRNFSAPSGASGHFQTATQVYGRAGLPCPVCQTPVLRSVQGQRATYFCPRCQPLQAPPHPTGMSGAHMRSLPAARASKPVPKR